MEERDTAVAQNQARKDLDIVEQEALERMDRFIRCGLDRTDAATLTLTCAVMELEAIYRSSLTGGADGNANA